jgi:hypothetical protein
VAKLDDDPFERTDFEAAQAYVNKHPEFALCRVKHDVNFHRPPVEMEPHSDGGWTHVYICGGCESEYHRRYYADGRFMKGTWKYAEGYKAEPGSGYGLVSRSGKAAFNLALRDLMASQPRPKKSRSRTK